MDHVLQLSLAGVMAASISLLQQPAIAQLPNAPPPNTAILPLPRTQATPATRSRPVSVVSKKHKTELAWGC